MDNSIILYHGSISIIEKPIYGYGKKYNDYGLGFYCTESLDLAKEWAVDENNNGYANKYILNLDGLKILNLNNYSILNWITILLQNRVFSINTDIAKLGKEYLIKNYNINIDEYDVIIGYRADDSYFNYASSFLNNTISLERLSEALKLGNLGNQVVLKSKKAFDQLTYLGNEISESNMYYRLRIRRNDDAKDSFLSIKREKPNINDTYLTDIIRGVIKNDSRL